MSNVFPLTFHSKQIWPSTTLFCLSFLLTQFKSCVSKREETLQDLNTVSCCETRGRMSGEKRTSTTLDLLLLRKIVLWIMISMSMQMTMTMMMIILMIDWLIDTTVAVDLVSDCLEFKYAMSILFTSVVFFIPPVQWCLPGSWCLLATFLAVTSWEHSLSTVACYNAALKTNSLLEWWSRGHVSFSI